MLRNFKIITTQEGVSQVCNTLANTEGFALDLETTSLDFNRGVIHGVALATDTQEWYVTLGAEELLFPHLNTLVAKRTVYGHNLVFDMHFLRKRGVEVRHFRDTMIAQFLVDENQRIGLKSLAETKLGYQDLPDFKDLLHLGKKYLGARRLDGVSIYDVPLQTLAEYAARDVRLTLDLWDLSEYELSREGMTEQFFNIEMPFLKVLLDMEETGFYIDYEKLVSLGSEFTIKRDDALNKFNEISGGVNPNSTPQLGTYLYDVLKHKVTSRTEKGAPAVDIMALNRMLPRDKNGAVACLLEYRRYEKLIGTYITSFQQMMFNGRLYGGFNQTGTVTGRLSSSSPNLQNIPARGGLGKQIRSLFSAPEGYTFLDIDYSQLELRIGAHYTKDPNLIKVFRENGDPHQMTADLTNTERFIGKTLNFSVFYGAGPRKLCDTVEEGGNPRPRVDQAQAWLLAFDKAYPTIKNWKERVIEYARELGYVKTIGGRKRRLPDLKSQDQSLRGGAERQAVNSIIQGSAADITKYAMIEIAKFQDDYDTRMLAQVHDELCLEGPNSTIKEFGERASKVMRQAGEHFNMRVDLVAEPGYGKNWAEAK